MKGTLDLDWDDPEERAQALVRVLDALDGVEEYLESTTVAPKAMKAAQMGMESARRVRGACEIRT